MGTYLGNRSLRALRRRRMARLRGVSLSLLIVGLGLLGVHQVQASDLISIRNPSCARKSPNEKSASALVRLLVFFNLSTSKFDYCQIFQRFST